MRTVVAAILLLIVGCGDDGGAGAAGGADAGGGAGPAGGALQGGALQGGAGGGGGGACAENAIPLLAGPQRFYVPVTFEGEEALFFIDTGSSLTFLELGPDDPDFVEDAATIQIGCETLTIPGRGGLAPLQDAFGKKVIGFLGADFLIERTALLDVANETLTRPAPPDAIAQAAAWPALAYDDVQGHVIAPVELDGTPVRLMLDTGAYDTLWLGQQGQPGDREIQTTDAEGNLLTFYLGEVDLTMAGRETITVPVLRAPSFPYFEQTVEQLGGNIHGLLGLTSFGGRAMLFDGEHHEVRLGPR